MLRVTIRFIGLMLLAAGFAALVVDGTRSIASNGLVLTSLAETATQLAPVKFQAMQAAVEKRFGAWAVDTALATVLALPAWLLVGAIGAALLLATRRRRAPIGFSSR